MWYHRNMAKKSNTKKLGWHFLRADMRLGYGDGRTAAVGKTLSIPASRGPSMCSNGMHASVRPSDAAGFGKGPVVTRVEVWGDISTDSDKFCGRHRRVLWARTLTDRDVKALKKAVKYPHTMHGNVVSDLTNLAAHDPDRFDKWVEALYAKRSSVQPIPRRSLTEKDLLAQLMPRTIRTKAEVLRDIGGFFDMDPASSNYDDRFDELIDDLECSDKIIIVNNFTRGCNDGYVLRPRER